MITRWPVERVHSFDNFTKMMADVFGTDELRSGWVPAVDVKETKKEITFVFEVPGMHEKDVRVEFVGDTMFVSGTREFNKEEKRDDYVRIERSYGSFKRSFTLDVPVKHEEICASCKNGLLTVVVPKEENRPSRTIEVKG